MEHIGVFGCFGELSLIIKWGAVLDRAGNGLA
jgi:hypothetical protein